MEIDELAAQSDDVYERINFLNQSGGEEVPGVMGWREGAENRVVFHVWGGPSFAATGPDLVTARRLAREGIEQLGFCPQLEEDSPVVMSPSAPRFEPVLWWLTLAILLALLLPALVRAEIPAPGVSVQFPNAPYDWRYEGPDFDPRSTDELSVVRQRALAGQEEQNPMDIVPRISILDRQSGEIIARYRIENGSFCDYEDDNCERDGIFPLVPASAPAQPVLVAITHVGAHGQKISVFQPLINSQRAVFEAVADYALHVQVLPDGLTVELDFADGPDAVRHETRTWQAGEDELTCPAAVTATLSDPLPLSGSAATLARHLQRIVQDRDLDAFMAMLADDVLVSFGGDGGREEFIEYKALNTDTGRARFWAELEQLLATGGWHEPDMPQSVTWPWYFSAWPADEDAYDIFFVSSGAVLRAGPHEHSPVLDRLPFGPVRFAAPDDERRVVDWHEYGWTPVAAPGHCLGYVRNEDVRPLLGTRMIARDDGGGWKIEAFVAGD